MGIIEVSDQLEDSSYYNELLNRVGDQIRDFTFYFEGIDKTFSLKKENDQYVLVSKCGNNILEYVSEVRAAGVLEGELLEEFNSQRWVDIEKGKVLEGVINLIDGNLHNLSVDVPIK